MKQTSHGSWLPRLAALSLACFGQPVFATQTGSTADVVAHSVAQSSVGGLKDQELTGLANFDRYLATDATSVSPLPTNLAGRPHAAQFDRALGNVTFLWAPENATPTSVGPLTGRELLVAQARAYLREEAAVLGLSVAQIDEAEAFDAQFNGDGPAVVRFRQKVQGREVFHRALNVLLDHDHRPIAVSGYFATDFDANDVASRAFSQTPEQAVAAAWGALGGTLSAAQLVRSEQRGAYEYFNLTEPLAGTHVFERAPRVKPVYYARSQRLVPAYYVELFALARANRELIAYGVVVSAADGQLLHRRNLKANAAYTYRVFADDADNGYQPYDSPLGNGYTPFPGADPVEALQRSGVDSRLVTLEHAGIVTGDPWLPENATETLGNHVDACLDSFDTPLSGLISNPLNICTPLLGDMRPAPNGPNTFDYMVVADSEPSTEEAQSAAIVNMFYITNWLHDWWYNHGFDEQAGNAQTDNYGRGGVDGDPLLAQGQDASGRSNANMATPADGSSPTMQQYLFDGRVQGLVRQTAPVEGAALKFSTASFGPDDYNVDGQLVLADETGGEVTTDGCGLSTLNDQLGVLPLPAPPQTALMGNVALVDRGGCNFTTKAQFAMLSGATALIVVNNTDGEPIPMGNGDLPIDIPLPIDVTGILYQIPAVMIRRTDGEALKAQLAAGETVMVHLDRTPSTDLDGTLDNQIIAHEYFHYVHHRLTDSSNQQSGAMSEGWGDIGAFMLSLREEDRLIPGNDRYQGAYGLAGYVIDNFYGGIRRVPYSTDFDKNAFTFKHISDGEATPDGGAGASNSEVHNAGEIWANAVFECYVGILNDPRHSFAEARDRMKDYIIGGFKMTPADATFTEGRDAILAVVRASDKTDYANCSAGFAKRGMGPAAVSPARDSSDLVGVVEDYTPFVSETDSRSFGATVRGGALAPWLLLGLCGLGWRTRRSRR